MRFGDIYNDTTVGSLRVIEKFLWYPLTIEHQTRWLEKAKIRQVCRFYGEDYGYKWENDGWIDNEKN